MASHFVSTLCVQNYHTVASLKAKQQKPKAKGLGNKPRRSDSLKDEEIEKLYASKCLGMLSSHYRHFVAKFDLTFQPSRRQTERCQTQANAQRKRVFVVLGGFYIIKRKLHGRLKIRNFSSRVGNISLAYFSSLFIDQRVNSHYTGLRCNFRK